MPRPPRSPEWRSGPQRRSGSPDNAPPFAPPHFHAFYQEHEAKIDIEKLDIISGHLPRRALGLVLDWAELHQQELRENWVRAEQRRMLNAIKPLE